MLSNTHRTASYRCIGTKQSGLPVAWRGYYLDGRKMTCSPFCFPSFLLEDSRVNERRAEQSSTTFSRRSSSHLRAQQVATLHIFVLGRSHHVYSLLSYPILCMFAPYSFCSPTHRHARNIPSRTYPLQTPVKQR
mmetsp:Transcript_44110/g.114747  ORF Transcript_44110/g.114747 Transcript_44110/m.114747 type:complete len:134 (-) Transcript_44110:226-627(-)